MMMTPRENWTEANEDAMSTGSGNSDSELNNRTSGGTSSSEYIPLRFPHTRIMEGRKPKAVITALGLTVVIVASAVFGTVYFSGGEANGIEHKTDRLADHDHEVFVRDLSEPSDDEKPLHATAARRTSSNHELILSSPEQVEIQSDAPRTGSNTSSTTRSRKKSNRSRTRQVTHGPRPLPANAQTKPAISLLYEMKLAHGPQSSFVKYAKCEDILLDNQRLFKGWKAVLPVNLTGAGLNVTDHQSTFEGYGTRKTDARRRAAEIALSTLYPALEYAGKDDYSDIDVYCTATPTLDAENGPSGNNSTSTTTATT